MSFETCSCINSIKVCVLGIIAVFINFSSTSIFPFSSFSARRQAPADFIRSVCRDIRRLLGDGAGRGAGGFPDLCPKDEAGALCVVADPLHGSGERSGRVLVFCP